MKFVPICSDMKKIVGVLSVGFLGEIYVREKKFICKWCSLDALHCG